MNIKKHWPLLTGGVLLLAVAFTQQATVPLYDGVGMPDEPYRYVQPPVGFETEREPDGAESTGIAADGTNKDGFYITTNEQGPQFYASFTQSIFSVSSRASLITLKVRPLAVDGKTPTTGKIAGNIYSISASSDSGPVSYVANTQTPSYIDMRLPQGYPVGSTMVYRPKASATWQVLETTKVGADIYEAKSVGFGDYALTSQASLDNPNDKNVGLVVRLAAVAAAVVVCGLLVRRLYAAK